MAGTLADTPALLPFEIHTGGNGDTPKVIVNDENVTEQLRGLNLTVEAGTVPQLALYTHAAGTITGEGIVEVHPLAADLGAAVRGLDGDQVKARWLAGQRMGVDVGQLLLDVVADMLDEAGP